MSCISGCYGGAGAAHSRCAHDGVVAALEHRRHREKAASFGLDFGEIGSMMERLAGTGVVGMSAPKAGKQRRKKKAAAVVELRVGREDAQRAPWRSCLQRKEWSPSC